MKTVHFSDTILFLSLNTAIRPHGYSRQGASDLKVSRSRHLIEYMKVHVCEY